MAADDKSSSSSSADWTAEPPVISPSSPSHLTHFKPLTPEQDEPPLRSAYSSFVNLFRFNNKAPTGSIGSFNSTFNSSTDELKIILLQRRIDWLKTRRKSDASLSHDPRTAVQLRTALKRLKEIMEGKSQSQHLVQRKLSN
uniref:Uncharacterized protein n=1 Tax=Stegastes partitus TaxID=144197 RepID=A0A3B4ZRK0_9TELE